MKQQVYLLFLFCHVLLNESNAQRLLPIIGDNSVWPLVELGVIYDMVEFNDELIAGGNIDIDFSPEGNSLVVWNGTSINAHPALLDGIVYCLAVYNNALYAGVRIQSLDYVMKLNGNVWEMVSPDMNSYVYDLRVHDNELYCSGSFDSTVMKYNGLAWTGVIGSESFNYCKKLETWNGKLYGIFNDSIVAYHENDSWITLTSALYQDVIYDFTKKDGDLYVTGEFEDGNNIHGLMRIDGNELVLDTSADHLRRIYSAQYYHGHWYAEDFVTVYKDDQPFGLVDVPGNPIIRGSGITPFEDDLIFALEANQSLFVVDNGMHLYKLEDGNVVNNLHLEGHEINAFFDANADFFAVGEVGKNFNYPDDSLTSVVYGGQLVACATSGSDTIVAGPHYSNSASAGWIFGPITNDIDQQFVDRYFKTWKVTADQIQQHITNYNQPDYIMPDGISTWPGNGHFDRGEAHMLAPFVDLGGDSWYDPEQGDYPAIEGDEAVFMMLNDKYSIFEDWYYDGASSEPRQMNIETHLMFYSFANESSPINRTVFLKAWVFNRSQEDYSDFRIGIFNDFDIGNALNDYCGSNADLNYAFAYNSEDDDPDIISTEPDTQGYTGNPPAVACTFLNHDMDVNYIAAQSPQIDFPDLPSRAIRLYRNMHGLGWDGLPVEIFNIVQGPIMFPDSPCLADGDHEATLASTSTDRVSISTTPDMILTQGQYICFDVAYTVSEQTLNHLGNVCSLENIIPLVREYYDNNLISDCNLNIAVDELETAQNLNIYPVPVVDYFTVLFGTTLSDVHTLTVYDITGNMMLSKTIPKGAKSTIVDMTGFANGTYLVRMNEYSTSVVVCH